MEEGSRGQEEAAQLDLLQLFFFLGGRVLRPADKHVEAHGVWRLGGARHRLEVAGGG